MMITMFDYGALYNLGSLSMEKQEAKATTRLFSFPLHKKKGFLMQIQLAFLGRIVSVAHD